jgi:hypothetical protein
MCFHARLRPSLRGYSFRTAFIYAKNSSNSKAASFIYHFFTNEVVLKTPHGMAAFSKHHGIPHFSFY